MYQRICGYLAGAKSGMTKLIQLERKQQPLLDCGGYRDDGRVGASALGGEGVSSLSISGT